MNMVDWIRKKRRGAELTTAEIGALIDGYTAGMIPDYQMSAMLMAICFQGMTARETSDLTMAMARSGEMIDLSAIDGIKVDKHSTGGVGDKISLVALPLAAAAGVPIAKMSGRGLGHTGGTIDKLESISGFCTDLSEAQFIDHVNRLKLALTGQSERLAPADKLLYALRDVTATVDSLPLIASSIMSKKIASGADAIVLDVKTGSGAFMKSLDEARSLANAMVAIGQQLGRRTVAIISDMSQPLGREVGNANEVREAIEVLRGEGPDDVATIALTIAAHMAVLGGRFPDVGQAMERLRGMLASGEALAVFRRFIAAQGGDAEVVDEPGRLPRAPHSVAVSARETGYIGAIDAEAVGLAAMLLGAGRQRKEEPIDLAAGVTLLRKTGDAVRAGDDLCIMHTSDDPVQAEAVRQAEEILQAAYRLTEAEPPSMRYIHEIVTE